MTLRTEIADNISEFSFGVKIDFTIVSRGSFANFEGESLSLMWENDLILELQSRNINPKLYQSGARGYRLIANAYQTATEAEATGLRLSYSLLRFCIDRGWGVTLCWQDSPYPCRVVDRMAPLGLSFSGYAEALDPVPMAVFEEGISSAYATRVDIPNSLLLSMELFVSSQIESNQRSKLIMIVSALEALATQKDYSSEIENLVAELKRTVRSSDIEDKGLKQSLLGQIENLKRESIRRALRRLMDEHSIPRADCDFVEEAYKYRSLIVHEGKRLPRLSSINGRLSGILRELYLKL